MLGTTESPEMAAGFEFSGFSENQARAVEARQGIVDVGPSFLSKVPSSWQKEFGIIFPKEKNLGPKSVPEHFYPRDGKQK